MRYTTAATVAVLATGAVAAGHGHAAHHHHHEREANAAAEAKPEPTNYTYSDGQCWGDMGCEAKTGAPAAATSAPAQATVVAAAVTQAAAPAKAAKPASSFQSVASKATSAAGSVASSVSGGNVNVANMISAVKDVSGAKDSMKAAVLGGNVAEDGSKKNQVNISNNSGKNLAFICWGPAQSWVNTYAPILALGMAPNDKKTISFDDTPSGQQGGACSVIYEGGSTINQGQIFDTWIEWTFNQYGVVDVSREPNMGGSTSFSASSPSGCTTSMDKCVYKCTDGTNRCGAKGTYQNMNCAGTGANPSPTDGGCMIGSGGSIDLAIS